MNKGCKYLKRSFITEDNPNVIEQTIKTALGAIKKVQPNCSKRRVFSINH